MIEIKSIQLVSYNLLHQHNKVYFLRLISCRVMFPIIPNLYTWPSSANSEVFHSKRDIKQLKDKNDRQAHAYTNGLSMEDDDRNVL